MVIRPRKLKQIGGEDERRLGKNSEARASVDVSDYGHVENGI